MSTTIIPTKAAMQNGLVIFEAPSGLPLQSGQPVSTSGCLTSLFNSSWNIITAGLIIVSTGAGSQPQVWSGFTAAAPVFSGSPFSVTASEGAVSGIAHYDGSFGGFNSLWIGQPAIITGFVSHISNNGTFIITGGDTTHLFVANANASAESAAASASISYMTLPIEIETVATPVLGNATPQADSTGFTGTVAGISVKLPAVDETEYAGKLGYSNSQSTGKLQARLAPAFNKVATPSGSGTPLLIPDASGSTIRFNNPQLGAPKP